MGSPINFVHGDVHLQCCRPRQGIMGFRLGGFFAYGHKLQVAGLGVGGIGESGGRKTNWALVSAASVTSLCSITKNSCKGGKEFVQLSPLTPPYFKSHMNPNLYLRTLYREI
ncbi:hypothetical protein RJT34_14820 [Clitoria ternatea]|uniref:Uncharacterized protein n=1 Tax=Clitoria ternatea TaxID=43366 RepID=A0AAN9PNG9_CLITE